MRRRLLISYLSVTALVLAMLVIPLGLTFSQREQERLTTDLERDANVLAMKSEEALEATDHSGFDALVSDYSDQTGARAVIVGADGISVTDSGSPDGIPRDFSTRPEIDAALMGRRTTGIRHSETLGTDLMYVAIPVASGGEILGAIRLSFPTSEVDRRVRDNWLRLGGLSLAVLAVVTLVGVVLARSVTRPITELEGATSAIAAGQLSQRVPVDRGPPEIRSLGRSFNAMAIRLGELIGAKDTFVADASHQLRTPLTALRLRLENIESQIDGGARHDLSAAVAETNRLSRLVDGLLLLARAEGERPRREDVDLAVVARERQLTWDPLAAERDVAVSVTSTGDCHVLAIDGAADQIIDNLIDNALDVSPSHSTISIVVEGRDDQVLLSILDQGSGMSEADREKAFERFWRGPNPAGGGSGLGLAVVRQLATQCNAEAALLPSESGGIEARVVFGRASS